MPKTEETFDNDKFDKAFESVLQMEKKDYPSYVNGMKIASGVDFVISSPIDESIRYGFFQEPEEGITEYAVEESLKAFEKWSKSTPAQRTNIFEDVLDVAVAQRYRLAALVLISTGMTRLEAMDEVDRLIDIIRTECSKIVSGTVCKPKGVWAVITAHNSPLASPVGFSVAAMLAGNTVVVMPSKFCPVPVYALYDIFMKAGLPEGVMNLIVDRKDKTILTLANDPRLTGVVASGSGEKMEEMMFLGVDDELSFVNELKGMNPAIVYKPKDMKRAVSDILDSAFRYCGQHLYSTSKVIVCADDQQKFMDALMEQVKDLRFGDPAEPDTFAGPVISCTNRDALLKLTEGMREYVLFGGKKVTGEDTDAGWYVVPVILTGLNEDSDIAYMDTGLPVLVISVVNDFKTALEELDNTECGLSAGIFTKDANALESFKSEADAPLIYANMSSRTLLPAFSAKVESFN